MTKFIDNIFSLKNKSYDDGRCYKVLRIFGFKIKFKNHKKMQEKNILECIQLCNQIKDSLHDISVCNEIKNTLQGIRTQDFTSKYFTFKFYAPKSYYEQFCTNDINEKYLKLIDGLDTESIKIFNRVLFRIQQHAFKDEINFEVDAEEFKDLDKIRRIQNSAVKLNDGLYAYENYVVPTDFYCAASLYYKHFINDVEDKDKIYNGDIIDAGAYVGDSALVLSPYTSKNIYSFEPEAANYEKIKQTIEVNHLKNVIPVKKGLGDTITQGNVNDSIYDFGYSITTEDYDNPKEKIEITTVDAFVKENNLKVGLIKTDVEGFEQQLLKGALETIKRDKPVLMISMYHTFNDYWDLKPMIENLNLGYKFKIRKPAIEDIYADLVLMAEVPNN